MLQLMMKTFDCATRKVVCVTTLSLLVGVASAGLAAGPTQTPAQTPTDSQSSSPDAGTYGGPGDGGAEQGDGGGAGCHTPGRSTTTAGNFTAA